MPRRSNLTKVAQELSKEWRDVLDPKKRKQDVPFMQEERTYSEHAKRFFAMSAQEQIAEMQRRGPELETILRLGK